MRADEKPAVVSFGTGKDGSDTSFGAQMFNLSFMLTESSLTRYI